MLATTAVRSLRRSAGAALRGEDKVADDATRAECAICLHPFGANVVARVLGCGHSFCEPCLQTMIDMIRQPLRCPTCRSEHKATPSVSAADLPRNFALDELLSPPQITTRAISGDQHNNRHVALCENCSSPASVMCRGCSDLQFCRKCIDQIHSSLPPVLLRKARDHHRPVPLLLKSWRCEDHSGAAATFFCETDRRIVCSECLDLGGHSSHTITSIRGAASKFKALLEQQLTDTREALRALRVERSKAEKAIKKMEVSADEARTAIIDRASSMIATVERARDEMLRSVDSITRQRLETLRDAAGDPETEMRNAEQVLSRASTAWSDCSGARELFITKTFHESSRAVSEALDRMRDATSACSEQVKAASGKIRVRGIADDAEALSRRAASSWTVDVESSAPVLMPVLVNRNMFDELSDDDDDLYS